MKLTVPPLQIESNEGFTSEKDIFNRKDFGQNLLNLIINTDDELVIALDAPWGEGKTTFIKMWQGMLAQEGIKSIYFDAFANDYQKDPFLAIAAEIYSLIKKETDADKTKLDKFKDKTTSALKTLGRAGLRIGIKAATAGILDETIFEDTNTIKDVSKETSDLIDSYVAARLENAERDKQTLSEFRHTLSELASSVNNDKPLVFIIDELDRCKPNFALEILENVKHLYSVKNIVFVLVTNRKQLEESVKCQYGLGIDASKYLQKFVHLWAYLPKRKKSQLSDNFDYDIVTYIVHCLNNMKFYIDSNREKSEKLANEIVEFYKNIAIYYNLSLREIEYSLTNYSIVHNITGGNLNFDYQIVLIYLSIIKVIKPIVYQKILCNRISYQEIVKETNLIDYWCIDYFEYGSSGAFSLEMSLRACFCDYDELYFFTANILEHDQQKFVRDALYQTDNNIVKNICKWISNFQ